MDKHDYTPEQVEFLAKNIKGRSYADMTALFNERFGTTLSFNQVRAALKNRGLCNGRNTRIKPGNLPHNKGKKNYWRGGEATQFKKGQMPHNYKPVGSERINSEGYCEVKIADPKKWRGKHLLVWEAANGPIPKGHAVIFGDGDRANFALENLLLVSRGQLAVMNKRGMISNSAELTESAAIIASILMAVTRRKRNKRSEINHEH